MDSLWRDDAAEAVVADYAHGGVEEAQGVHVV